MKQVYGISIEQMIRCCKNYTRDIRFLFMKSIRYPHQGPDFMEFNQKDKRYVFTQCVIIGGHNYPDMPVQSNEPKVV